VDDPLRSVLHAPRLVAPASLVDSMAATTKGAMNGHALHVSICSPRCWRCFALLTKVEQGQGEFCATCATWLARWAKEHGFR